MTKNEKVEQFGVLVEIQGPVPAEFEVSLEGVDADRIVEDLEVETYYCPLKGGIQSDGFFRFIGDNEFTDVELRVPNRILQDIVAVYSEATSADIKVTPDTLPESGATVLAFGNDPEDEGDLHTREWHKAYLTRDGGYFISLETGKNLVDVTHWREMPE